MKRAAMRMLDRASPWLGQLLRDVYGTLRGARMAEVLAELQRLRHAAAIRPQDGTALRHSLARLAEGPRRGGIAVISVMPPAETGIATFTRASFRHAGYPVDIYAPCFSFEDYADRLHDPALKDSPARVFALQALAMGRQANDYAAEIYVLGNSDHNLPVYEALRRSRDFPPAGRLWVHVHDPGLMHLLAPVAGLRGGLAPMLRAHYADRLGGLDMARAQQDPGLLAERGILGVRALLDGLPIDRLLVNSAAARELLLAEMPSLRPEQVLQLFHPVFPEADVALTAAPRAGRPVIGSFGVPSPYKQTEVVLEAMALLRQRMPEAVLLLAGYGAGDYAQRMGLDGLPYLRVVDAPSDGALLGMMRSVDLAVQLRSGNRGESSGVVPQLLGCGTPVVVSATGSFLEFGDAVRAVPPGITAEALAAVMAEEIAGGADRREGIARYVATHGPEVFCARIGAALGLGPAMPEDVPAGLGAGG
ncbi:glycosyltransferase family 4 protein [Roseomonas sp. SSH11]|uniref:Glycosyltransferase family 4 protein n=1 Tax=Pararoseomonas baculiformis TaxID=2820812 RepID=A0ABS4AH96_9PROT|nr:glycosyltransferase family 4 protein [Pararoseomonas baculiformis]MBP0446375.1 glycosyltransferase family 4 protein [Pararoseomonas baculiformis]